MKILDRIKAKFVRRPDFHVAPAQAEVPPPTQEEMATWVPRNRAERRLMLRWKKMDGRRRMRMEGRRRHNHRTPRRIVVQHRNIKRLIRELEAKERARPTPCPSPEECGVNHG